MSTSESFAAHRAAGRVAHGVFGASEAIMRRLKLPQKFLLVAALLVTPFVVVGISYVNDQNSQASFASGERAGLVVVDPLTRLLGAVDGVRAGAAGPRSAAAASVTQAVDRVDAALAGDRVIHIAGPWSTVKTAIDVADGHAGGPGALAAWSRVSDRLVSLIALVADQSKLTLDPILNTYYLQDAVTVKIPTVLSQAGLASALAVSGVRTHHDAVAIADGAATAAMAGLSTDLQKATASSHGLALGTVNARLSALEASAAALTRDLTRAVASGHSPAGDPATAVRRDALALAAATTPRLDGALLSHVDHYRSNEHLVELVALIVLLVAAWLFIGFFRSMTGSVNELIDVLSAVEAGDLSSDATGSGDEVGQMAVALNRMRARMSEMVDRIARTSATLSSASVELSAVSSQMTSAAERTSDRAGSVSAAAEQVSDSVQTVSAGTEQMNASINEIARQAAEAARVATEAVAAAETTNGVVGRLGDSSAEIDEVIKFIGSIAQQTNLLALNATIEAARAGDAGRGFAVVASEIKELARDTTVSSEKIERSIATIQTDTREAVRAIGEITSTIHHINDIQSMIASAVEEQAVTTSEIARSVGEAAGGSGSIATSITDVAAGARETRTGAEETQRSAEELSRLAAELYSLTSHFRLRSSAPEGRAGDEPVPTAPLAAARHSAGDATFERLERALAAPADPDAVSTNGHR